MAYLSEGSLAPGFIAVDQNGNEISLKDYFGKKVILYFYPKDNTPGCTAEACNFRDNFGELTDRGFVVIGVSPDNAKSHNNFIKKYELPYILIPDEQKEILNKYGAWGEKNMYGKKTTGVLRTTYIIDEQGKIENVIEKVNTGNHAEQILTELGKK